MAEHPNLAVARAAWTAVSDGDAAALEKIATPDVVWHATSRGTPWSGDHHGASALLDHLARIGESVEVFDARLDDILVSDERFAFVFRIRAERGDRQLDVGYQLLARLRDGLVSEVWTAPLDSAALAAFWD